ncbi:MAG: hypothetical protein ACI80V_001613 [Rhodothermales bacterium]|jgi:hypothetical protein
MRRATELQVMDPGEKEGLTQADLEQIAADSGIPPQYLRTAILEADHGVSSRDVSGQTKTHAYIDRVVPGELSEDEWAQVVMRLRKEYSSDLAASYGGGPQYGKGVSEQLGRTREWSHTTSLGVTTNVAIRSADGKQHISFQRRVGLGSPRVEGIGYGLLLASLMGGIAGVTNESALLALLVTAAVWAVAAPAVEYLDRRWRDKMLRQMQAVSDDIARIVADPVVESGEATTLESPAGSEARLDLDGLEAPEPEANRAGQRTRA